MKPNGLGLWWGAVGFRVATPNLRWDDDCEPIRQEMLLWMEGNQGVGTNRCLSGLAPKPWGGWG